jgi:hypothetical protein
MAISTDQILDVLRAHGIHRIHPGAPTFLFR